MAIPPRSLAPVCIMGISAAGESVQEWDINLGTSQGPSDDLDEVIISSVHTSEAEARYEERRSR